MHGLHDHMSLPSPEHQSIFTDVYDGVPNPLIPHEHPYPTRYHGPNYNIPMFYLPYREQSWQAPIGLPAQKKVQSCTNCPMSGMGDPQPHYLSPALFGTASGNTLTDALIGLGLGYIVAPKPGDRAMWAGVGAVAGLLAGTIGLLGTVGSALYLRHGR